MQTSENKLSEANNTHWLDIAEILAVTGSIGSSIACILLQKFAYASIPLSVSVALNLLNRQRMMKAITEKNQSIIAAQLESSDNNYSQLQKDIETKIQTQYQKNKSRYSDLSEELEKLQNIANVDLKKRFQLGENQLINISQEIQDIRKSLSQQAILNQKLDDSFSNLTKQQVETHKIVKEMRVMSNNQQNAMLDDSNAHLYYEKGLFCQKNGYHEQAQKNYQKALELEPLFAEVYHHRGLLYQEIGEKKQAHEDFKKASQLYFENRDLDNYNLTRNLSQKVHQQEDIDGNSLDKSKGNNKVVLNELFS